MAQLQGKKRPSDANIPNPSSGEESGGETPRTATGQAKRKRVRLSDKRGRTTGFASNGLTHHTEEDDEDEVTEDEPMRERRELVANGVGSVSSEAAGSDSEEDAAAATQALKQRYEDGESQNHAAECAIIEEITCTNFMCHEHLKVKIGPLINFIIGHNGSGKSAVLTALQICLGGKATATNRGQNLKSLIKEGREFASLSVRIKNQGESAYKTEEYGKSIIVERHWNRAGSSGFKIKNALGKIVSTKRDDLNDILDVFSLQLDNPMNILTQDMARQFLNSSTPQDKYKFFQKGTHLEQLDNDYTDMENYLEEIGARTQNVQEDRQILKEAYERAAAKAKRAEKQKSLNDQLRETQRQLAWALVGDERDTLAKMEADVAAAEALVQERQAAVDDMQQQLDAATNAKQQAADEIIRAKDAKAPLDERFEEIRAEFQRGTKMLMEIQGDERGLVLSLHQQEKQIKKTEDNIVEEEEKLANIDNGQHGQQKLIIDDLQAKKDDHAKELEALAAGEVSARSREIRTRDLVNPLNEELKRGQRAVAEQESVIQRLRSGANSNWKAAYHPNLPRLLQEIERNKTHFRQEPVGPLGRHISLVRPQWSSILEKSFGAVLDGFAVTCKDDQRVLSDLMRKASYQGRVFIGNPRPFDRPLNEPSEDKLTWLRAMKIENQLIKNIVLINQMPEQTVLIEDREEATRYQVTHPVNVKAILAMHDDRRGDGLRLVSGAGGGESSTFIPAWRGSRRMQSDEESRLNIENETLSQLKRDLKDSEQRHREAMNNAKQASQEATKVRRDISRLEEQVQRLDNEIEQQQDDLQAAMPETGKLDALKDQLKEQRKDQEREELQLEALVTNKDEINKNQKTLMSRMEAAKLEVQDAAAKVKKVELRQSHFDKQFTTLVLQRNEAEATVRDAQLQRTQADDQRQEQAHLVEEHEVHARRVCAPVSTHGQTSAAIEKKMLRLRNEVELAQKELGGTRDEIVERAVQAKRKYQQAEEKWRAHGEVTKALKLTLLDRRHRWEQFRTHIAIRAKFMFTYLLQERQFRGKLDLDHSRKTLDIKVEPDPTRKSEAGRQTKTLSGGEKSFSTICLLLSLWEAMGSPIRCLDEFDVFMDSVNRDIAMKMMIEAARRSVGRQFILITPQAMANVDFQPDVRIHRMMDPERGQQALPYGRT